MYNEAFQASKILSPYKDCEKWPCNCPDCYTLLSPLHVDDKEEIYFLRCPQCGEIYERPQWYKTKEERLINELTAKIAHLEARITALELLNKGNSQKQPERTATQPSHQEEVYMIELPHLLTIS